MIADLFQGVGARSHNGRHSAATGDKSPELTAEERLAWAMLSHAAEETKILCGYGLIRADGSLRRWPRVKRTDKHGHCHYDPMVIATMNDPQDHSRLKQFWNDPTQAQMWSDLIGFGLPAKDAWNGLLKTYAQ